MSQEPFPYSDPPPSGVGLVPMGTSPHIRDGFSAQVALGTVLLDIERVVRNEAARERSQVQAAGALFELFLGGSIKRNTALGGLLLSQTFQAPELNSDGSDADLQSLQFAFLGIALRHYFWSQAGLNASLALGVTNIVSRLQERDTSIGGPGGGASLAIGYDFWLSSELAFGAHLRGIAAGFSGTTTLDDASGASAADDRGVAFSSAIALTLSYY